MGRIKQLRKPIIGYKRVRRFDEYERKDVVIIQLTIPAGAYVTTGSKTLCNGGKSIVYKMRASEAIVGKCGPCLVSIYDRSFIYMPGRRVEAKNFNMDPDEPCASGIHFFRTKKEAEIFNFW